ncbi:Imm21 family immunity protein [Streptosporangium sp. NPDC000239]|uniref:Imm21 family immunity protein n=1 Tax=Streptosporangium sp. NPDC000239 TaxID=3154248 RepID=UPI003330B122
MSQPYMEQSGDGDLLWVTTLGGPHIVIPESVCRYWNGVPEDYPNDDDDEGDYGRAGEVDGYIGLIDVGPDKALVLGDYPAGTTFLPGHNIFVRWIAADSDADILQAATNMVGSAQWEEELVWDIREPVILFDSVHGYDYIRSEEHLRVDLPPGRYTVRAAYAQTEAADMVIVQLYGGSDPAGYVRDDLQVSTLEYMYRGSSELLSTPGTQCS